MKKIVQQNDHHLMHVYYLVSPVKEVKEFIVYFWYKQASENVLT